MNIASYQFLRNQTPAFSLNEAKSVLEGHVGNSIDGEIVIARYTDGDTVKSLMGIYYVSGSVKKVTISEPTSEIISSLTNYVDTQIDSLNAGPFSGSGKVILAVKQTNGLISAQTGTLAADYVTNSAAGKKYISGDSSVQQALNSLNDAVADASGGASGATPLDGSGITTSASAVGTKINIKLQTSTSSWTNPLSIDPLTSGLTFSDTIDAGDY